MYTRASDRGLAKSEADTVDPLQRAADLRSDTVTKPTAAMRDAMRTAVVDDDVLSRDPTTALLERKVAEIAGKEDGLYVPSGTMANLLAVLTHCDVRGSEFIVGSNAHIYLDEQGGAATLGGVHPRPIPNRPDGTMDLAQIEAAIRPDDDHYPVSRLVCLENTLGGTAISAEYTDAVGALCKKHLLALHVDGARIFNAAVHLGVPVSRLLRSAHSASICLSKGVGAPVGTVLVGSAQFVRRARRLRKAVGGGMRQSGVLAAAALVALEDVNQRLREDHDKMQQLVRFLETVPGLAVQHPVQTNICFLEVDAAIDPDELCRRLEERGVLTLGDGRMLRIVTHHQVDVEQILRICEVFRDVCTTLMRNRFIDGGSVTAGPGQIRSRL